MEKIDQQYQIGAFNTVLASATSMMQDPRQVSAKVLYFKTLCVLHKQANALTELQKVPQQQYGPEMEICKLFSTLNNGNTDQIYSQLKGLLDKGNLSTLAFESACELLLSLGKFEDAYVVAKDHCDESLTCNAIVIQCLLKVNRLDLAEQQLEHMKSINAYAPITQLAEAWTCIALGGTKIQDAFYIFQELLESFGTTAKLLNGQALCQMAMGNYAEAERLLTEAFNKSPEDPDVLINFHNCLTHLRKPSPHLDSLTNLSPSHPIIQETEAKLKMFDMAKVSFKKQ